MQRSGIISFLLVLSCVGVGQGLLNPLPIGSKSNDRPRLTGNPATFWHHHPTTSSSKSSLNMQAKYSSEKKSGMEVGIQTAQLLMDERRRKELRQQMKKQYPLVPDAVLDSSIDITAKAFTRVAPEKLKIALRPGGMDRVRPDIERVIVDFTLSQPVIQNVPVLDQPDKRKLVELLVRMSLDYVLKDAQEVLSAPEVQLAVLEEQMKSVKAIMGPWRYWWYRLRHSTIEIAVVTVASLAAFVVYQQRNAPTIAKALAILSSVAGKVLAFTSSALQTSRSSIFILLQKAGGIIAALQKMLLQR